MADDKPPRRPDRDIDGEVTSTFPADGLRRELGGGEPEADADSWVDQWSRLFSEEKPPGKHQQTREMPVYSAEQPPVDNKEKPTDRMPGHPDPAAQAKKRAQDQPPAPTHTPEPEPEPEHKSQPQSERKVEGDPAEILAWQRAQERTKRRAKLRANQRKAEVMRRQRPTQTGITIEDPTVATRPVPARSTLPASPARYGGAADRRPSSASPYGPRPTGDRESEQRPFPAMAVAVGVVLLLAGFILVGYLLTGLGPDDSEAASVSTEDENADAAAVAQGLEVGADVAPRGISELALSTVQLVGLNDELEPECAGSGVIVKADGTILTNAHVVTSEGGCQFTSIGVGLTVDSTSPAELLYRAEVLVTDPELDLAVLRIAGLLRPEDGATMPETFPQAPLGDSDTVELGDNVRILGYPVIGGDTITLTTGTVSGFSSQGDIGTRALIKTDATISAGNSGGLAVDPDGRIIGIPTKARASETGPAIDCRPLNDTNLDGTIDEQDNCVPVGGFLNGVRPINLALPLLEEASSAGPLGAVVTPDEVASGLDFEQVVIRNPRFALGERNDRPVDEITTATAGIPELCFFVDWSGIPVGTAWDGAWFVNGESEPDIGFVNQLWTIEEEGTNFWLCARERNAAGLPAGVYEIGFFLEGTLMFAEGIELTEEEVEVVPVTWTNDTEGNICELRVNPFSESGQVGLNELEPDVIIPPGGSRTLDLPLGKVIVEAYNCEGEPVADAFTGLEITEPVTFLIGL